ncbi:hypothetical protein [Iningainema tapete]|uniref:Uncharacterized protein n=1 Tax=Iningainema tapete BLCC-T55 TaxID=2748662 RepID=A0A8J6XI68_9CYAN|nr:hypothetical protein [Iningainema tapete]MBD2770662.1 hypothetical protein [Iningainema tapete BLCC-T55]
MFKKDEEVVHSPSGVQGVVYAELDDGKIVISNKEKTLPIDMASAETRKHNGWSVNR